MYSIMKEIFLFCFLCVFLSSCALGLSSSGTNKVQVFVVPFHSDSKSRTASGRPYIRTKAIPQICRWRPFQLREVYEQLQEEGIAEEVLDRYFLLEEEEGESADEREIGEPVYHTVGDNWIKFGLQITNLTNYVLVIDTVRFQARARCGSQTFQHSGEISTGYCGGEGSDAAPYLYVAPPADLTGTQINYYPQSSNPFDNLTLLFDGFPIIDRTQEASRSFQNAFTRSSSPSGVATGTAGATGTADSAGTAGVGAGTRTNRECQPNKTIVIPRYDIELVLIGYFMLPSGEEVEQVGHFTKRIRFSTTVIN